MIGFREGQTEGGGGYLTGPEKDYGKLFLQMLRAEITNIGINCFKHRMSAIGAHRVFCARILIQGDLLTVCTYTSSIINQKINKITT